MSFSNGFIDRGLVLVRGLFLICIVTIVVATVLVYGGDQPGLRLFFVAFLCPFTISAIYLAACVVSLGVRIAQRPVLSRWGVRVDAVAERWRHTHNRRDSGKVDHYYYVKATYVVPSSMYVQQPTPKQPTTNFEVTLEAITPEDSTTDEEQDDEATFEAVDMIVLHKWFYVSSNLYLTSQSCRKISLVVLPNQPYVVMTEEEANDGCTDFCRILLNSFLQGLWGLVALSSRSFYWEIKSQLPVSIFGFWCRTIAWQCLDRFGFGLPIG
jgi:hypothetical protein